MTAEQSTAELQEALTADFIERNATEAARVLEDVELSEAVELLERSPAVVAARLIERTNPERAVAILQAMDTDALSGIANLLDLQLLAALLARMEAQPREALLGSLGEATAAELTDLMSYPPDTAGSLMDPRAMVFRSDETADDALNRLRRLGREVGVDVHVVDEDSHLVGRISVQTLISAAADAKLGSLARAPISVPATASLEEVLEVGQGSLAGVSVVDVDNRLLGVIRRNRLTSAAEQDASADMQKMVGVSKEERALSPVRFAVRKRLPWLFINLATAFLAASVVGIFEATIAQVTALAVLLPVVAGQSGNSGSQALAVVIRGLALREVRISQWRKLASKEVMVGFINSVAIGIVTALGVVVWSGSIGLGLVIAAAMVISMAAAGMAGAAIPLTLKAIGQDPAQSSAIFLTTVTDVVGFLSFLGLATIFTAML
ncbi:MAG: magnesium transporter [Actinobacteria bacterium]|nr:magnesium transporter [Actinomycetota bacterium]